MTNTVSSIPRSFWAIGIVSMLWNALGVMTYLMSVTMSEARLLAMSEAERALYEHVPWWATSAYAIGVFGGVAGSVGLLMKKRWSVPMFVASLAGIVVQMGHASFMTDFLAVQGGSAAILPIVIVLVAACLVWYARSAAEKGWLR